MTDQAFSQLSHGKTCRRHMKSIRSQPNKPPHRQRSAATFLAIESQVVIDMREVQGQTRLEPVLLQTPHNIHQHYIIYLFQHHIIPLT